MEHDGGGLVGEVGCGWLLVRGRPNSRRNRDPVPKRLARALIPTLGVLLVVASCATPPRSEPTESPGASGAATTELTITIDETGSGATRTSTLTCEPAGGDHPDAEEACSALTAVGPEVFEEPAHDQTCTQQYGGPQVATVEGTVDGNAVRATFARTDGCEIAHWDSLVPLLPPGDDA